MTIAEILNVFLCSFYEAVGAGLKACKFDIKTPRTLILPNKGESFPADEEFNLESIQSKQQQGTVRVLQGVTDFRDVTPANDKRTFAATGEMSTSLKHPYMWEIDFDNGINFSKAVDTLEGNDRFDLIVGDSAGNLGGAMNKDGSFRGWDMGMLDSGPYVSGNENKKTITIQIDRNDFDRYTAGINNENLDFIPKRDLDDYNDVTIEVQPLSVGGTTISWKALLVDGSHSMEGALVTDYLLTKNVGGTISPVTMTGPINYNSTTQLFSATIPTAVAGTYTLRTNDAAQTPDTNIIVLTGVLYKGQDATVLVA